MNRAAAILLILITLCLAAITVLTIRPAHALQLACGPLPVLLKQLADRYHEFVVMTGSNLDGQQMLVTRSDAGTFTVLLGDAKGACVILAGEKAAFDNGI
ncbi:MULTISPECIES: hypothetical protein [Mesorhizobium]|uniref:hypothetical protein n=1 Tax=Mesorhizobium TaxID=68287 RepID=UPI0010A95A86|nr:MULTISPECIES: hypothetical protein [Mesorhizobium]